MHAYQALKREDMTSMWWVHKPGNYGSTRMHVEKYESTQSCQAHDLADSCTYNGFIFYNILLCQSFAKSFFWGGKGGGGVAAELDSIMCFLTTSKSCNTDLPIGSFFAKFLVLKLNASDHYSGL